MAKTQNDHLKSPSKDQENHTNKNVSLKPQVQQDLLGVNSQLAHAANFPEHATPQSIVQLQQRYGNNEVRRIIQRKPVEDTVTDNQDFLNKNIAGEIQSAKSGGQSLPQDVLDQMETKFGTAFGNVRVHDDQRADEISRKIQAKAFTLGNDIFFRQGAYSPNSQQGFNTLAHELTHVVQQSSGSNTSGPLKLGDPNDKFEQEAEGFAKDEQGNSDSKTGSSSGAIQRLSLAGVKKSVGGFFSSGSKPGSTPTSTTAPTTNPVPTTPSPGQTSQTGLKPEDLTSVQLAGVVDQAEWDSIPSEKQKLIFGLIKSDPALAQMLVTAFKASQWPKDDSGAEIFDKSTLKIIVNTLNISFLEWSALNSPYKKLLIDLKDKAYIQELIALAKTKKWPKDGNDQDISDEYSLKTITEILNITLSQWLSITDGNRRKFLLENGTKSYTIALLNLALQSKWPKDGNDQDISDENSLKTITETLKIPLDEWFSKTNKSQRGFLLKNNAQPFIVKLAEMALQGNWPKDGNDQDIVNENLYKLITVTWNIALDKWLTITEKKQRGFLLQNGTKPYAAGLLNLALQSKWPKDGSDQDIMDGNTFNIMTKTWNMTLDKWLTISDANRRKFLLENGTKTYTVELATMATQDKWPKDDTDQDITDDSKFNTITKTLKIPINTWITIADKNKLKCFLENGAKPYAVGLAALALQGNWPKDGSDQLIFDDFKLKTITETLKMSFANWLSITIKERRGFLLDNGTKSYIGELARLALQGNWPKDGSDQEIYDDTKFTSIKDTLKVSFVKWLSIAENNKRGYLLDNKSASYIDELVNLAVQGNWPLDKNGNAILDDGSFAKIKTNLVLSLSNWTKISSHARRGSLLDFQSALDEAQIKELALAAVSGLWPLDGGDQDISTASEWKKIKAAYPQMSPSYWNGLGSQTRGDALRKGTDKEIKEVINNANFRKNKKEGAMDKIGDFAGHGVTDTVLSSVGLAGSITSLSKGTGDNATLDRAGAGTSAAADAGNFLASSGSLLGSISQLRRGNKMSDKNSSRASKEFGEKQKSKGRWGISQSVFGMAGSGSSFAGNVTKANDPTSDNADKASSGLGVAGGFFGMVGSALGLGKGSASMNSARKRSSAAKKFIKETPTSGSLTPEETKMNAIAQFTAKNQNKTGKGFGIFKSVTSFVGSSLGTIGSIGSLAGMSKEGGFGLGIAGAAMSGLGILGGIGQMISEGKDKPSDSELATQATNLIELLRNSGPQRDIAAEFVKNVLKINLVTVGDVPSYTSWIDEDEAAATALIKSKLSKL